MKTLIVLSMLTVSALLASCESDRVVMPPVATTTTTTTHERVVRTPAVEQTTTTMAPYSY